MGVTANSGSSSEPATLVSPNFQSSYATCTLKFWHTLLGSGSSLNVSLLLNREKQVTIYRRDSSSTTSTWSLATIQLGRILHLNSF